jgi:hypothetical protein
MRKEIVDFALCLDALISIVQKGGPVTADECQVIESLVVKLRRLTLLQAEHLSGT